MAKRKQQTGFFWHVHHDVLYEYCYGYDERVSAIWRTKPKNEVRTRLGLFKPIRRLPAMCRAAWNTFIKARKDYHKACAAHNKVPGACKREAEAEAKASRMLSRTADAYHDTLADHKAEIEALHAKECGCKEWNGTEIVFPKKAK